MNQSIHVVMSVGKCPKTRFPVQLICEKPETHWFMLARSDGLKLYCYYYLDDLLTVWGVEGNRFRYKSNALHVWDNYVASFAAKLCWKTEGF